MIRRYFYLVILVISLGVVSCQEKKPEIPIRSMALSSVIFNLQFPPSQHQSRHGTQDDFFSRSNQLSQQDKDYFDRKTWEVITGLSQHALFKSRLIPQQYVFDNPIYTMLEHDWNPFTEYLPINFKALPRGKHTPTHICEALAVDAVILLEFRLFNKQTSGFIDDPKGTFSGSSAELYGTSQAVLEAKVMIIDRLGNMIFNKTFESVSDPRVKGEGREELYSVNRILQSTPYFIKNNLDPVDVDQVFEKFIDAFN